MKDRTKIKKKSNLYQIRNLCLVVCGITGVREFDFTLILLNKEETLRFIILTESANSRTRIIS